MRRDRDLELLEELLEEDEFEEEEFEPQYAGGGRGRSGRVALGMQDDRERPGRRRQRRAVERQVPDWAIRRKLEMIAAISVVLLLLWASQFLWR